MAAISPPPHRRRDTPPVWWTVGMALGTTVGAAGCYLLAQLF
jgi:hypothetical protein